MKMRPRLITPLLMSELNKMISLRNNNNNNISMDPSEAQRRILRVKKDLFGPVNHEDAKLFVEKELMAMTDSCSAKWNFDFINEKPIDTPNPRYIWKKVSPQDSISETYALKRFPYLSKNSVLLENNERTCNNNNILVNEDEFDSKTKEMSPIKSERQTQITDFMKYSRKRRNSVAVSKLAELEERDSLSESESEVSPRKMRRSLNTSSSLTS